MRRRLLWSAAAGAAVALVLLVLIARVLRSFVRYEDSLRRAAALAAIGQISALVAHEVKNPLAIIRSRSERVRARIEAGKDPREILEWFGAIPAEVDRLDAILTGYLSLARPEAEGEGTCDPAAVARETVELLRPELARQGVSAQSEFPDGTLSVAMGARSLKQILLNLLLNAMQAMDAGGVVTVRARREPGKVAIEVQDSGRGMSEEERRRAVEPFYTTRPAGSGLGLTLVQSLVQARGGTVEIRSAPGRGTRVSLLLPAAGGAGERKDGA
jgi:two-component system sensor histidine kinase HydH